MLPGAHGKDDVSRQLAAAPSRVEAVSLLNAAQRGAGRRGASTMSRMTSAQRMLIIAGCIVIAVMLNTLLCEWGYNSVTGNNRLIVGRKKDKPGGPQAANTFTGLVADDAIPSYAEAVVFGACLPLGLCIAAGYVALGWRRGARLAAGRCIRCGYDMRYDWSKGCAECGWKRLL